MILYKPNRLMYMVFENETSSYILESGNFIQTHSDKTLIYLVENRISNLHYELISKCFKRDIYLTYNEISKLK